MALAKAGDLAGALPCYDQALQLDPGNADALVARGAALANSREWQRASGERAVGEKVAGTWGKRRHEWRRAFWWACRGIKGRAGTGEGAAPGVAVHLWRLRRRPGSRRPSSGRLAIAQAQAASTMPLQCCGIWPRSAQWSHPQAHSPTHPPTLPSADDLEAALQLQPQHSNAQLYLDAVQSKAAGAGVQLEPFWAGQRRSAEGAHANGAQEQEQQQRKQQTLSDRQRRQPAAADAGRGEEQRQHGTTPGPPDSVGCWPQADSQRLGRRIGSTDPADGRSGRKRRRESASARRSRSRSRGRGRRSRDSSRSPGRRRVGSPASSSGGGSSGGSSNDSDAEAMAARLAEAQQRLQQPGGGEAAAGPEGLLGAGMDVATALQIVASHYKSRHGKEGKEEKRRRHKRESSKRHKHRHKKKHKKKRRH